MNVLCFVARYSRKTAQTVALVMDNVDYMERVCLTRKGNFQILQFHRTVPPFSNQRTGGTCTPEA